MWHWMTSLPVLALAQVNNLSKHGNQKEYKRGLVLFIFLLKLFQTCFILEVVSRFTDETVQTTEIIPSPGKHVKVKLQSVG